MFLWAPTRRRAVTPEASPTVRRPSLEPLFTPAELAEIQAYSSTWYTWFAVRDLFKIGLFAFVLKFGVKAFHQTAVRCARWLDTRFAFVRRMPVVRAVPAALEKLWGEPGWGVAVTFCLLYLLFLEVVYLPIDVHLDYFHEHRFGMSNETPTKFALGRLKSLGLVSIASTFLVFGLYGLARRLRLWWLVLGVVAGAVLMFSAALDPWRAQVYFDQHPLEAGPLRERIVELMSRAKVEYRDIVVEKTSESSKVVGAYFAGQGPTRTIVLYDNLLHQLGEDEILAAVAHEAAHVLEPRWIRRFLSAIALVAFLFGIDRLLRLAARRRWFGAERYGDIRTMPLMGMSLYAIMLLTQPLTAADSRARERAADQFALELTQKPDAFRRLMINAARINKTDPDPPRWIVLRAFSHPPLRERLAHADEFATKSSGR
ncbi:MAG: M48 family metalloprotease [Myxococcaceae bacterium]